ncbi:MAG: sugar transferase, partial [Oscillospiraceae bacterium]|nr:sugar transferase [Oscillospiraceae bacterium]
VTGVYDTVPYDKLKMDLMYIENYSFLRDIQIILMTIKIMIFPTQKTNEELEELLENFEKQRNQQ